MSESESNRDIQDAEHPAVDALARFLMTYDLTEAIELPEEFQPIVSSSLRRTLAKMMRSITEGWTKRMSAVHGYQRITLERREIDGKEWVFAGLAPLDLQERVRELETDATSPAPPVDATETPAPATVHPPPGPAASNAQASSFEPHFRGLRGEFYAMLPRELIQFFCSCGATLEVRFVSNFGETGEILMKQGVVIHVEAEGVTGESAVDLVMEWESGDFSTRPLREHPPRTIQKPWVHFLLEHAKFIDESGEFRTVPSEVRPETLESLPTWMDF